MIIRPDFIFINQISVEVIQLNVAFLHVSPRKQNIISVSTCV